MDSLHYHLYVLPLFIAVLCVPSITYENQICRVRSMVSYLSASSWESSSKHVDTEYSKERLFIFVIQYYG